MKNALTGGKILTRSQIKQLLTDANLCQDGQRVYHLTCYAGTLGIICFGPPIEKENTFVFLDEWIPKTRAVSYTHLDVYKRQEGDNHLL